MFGAEAKPMGNHFPVGIYGIPEVSMAGATEEDLTREKIHYFLTTVFNYPTLAECYKVAAHNAANKLALVRQATAAAPSSDSSPKGDRLTGRNREGGQKCQVNRDKIRPMARCETLTLARPSTSIRVRLPLRTLPAGLTSSSGRSFDPRR